MPNFCKTVLYLWFLSNFADSHPHPVPFDLPLSEHGLGCKLQWASWRTSCTHRDMDMDHGHAVLLRSRSSVATGLCLVHLSIYQFVIVLILSLTIIIIGYTIPCPPALLSCFASPFPLRHVSSSCLQHERWKGQLAMENVPLNSSYDPISNYLPDYIYYSRFTHIKIHDWCWFWFWYT